MDVTKLVKKAKKGNKEALLQLIIHQKDDYYRLAYTYLGNQHDAMDAMENMIVKLYENIHQLKKESSFYSWSKTILVNDCKELIKKKEKVVLVEEWNDHINHESLETNPILHSDDKFTIQWLLNQLNEQQAEAIRLKYILDFDYQSISELTQVPVGTVKSRIFEGLKKLKDLKGGSSNE
ncbi:RNA polymerase sigma factor [Cytobacillus sp. FJAT-54145]|uniref:RNA polymerase sigma factor n=1 Tax=Cytobacillus spartinae TaxID=3299023 RepID=A0ABW6K7W5_9BACI